MAFTASGGWSYMAHLPSAVRLSSAIALTLTLMAAVTQAQPRPKAVRDAREAPASAGATNGAVNVNDQKLDTALRAWVRGGSAGSRGAIVTVAPGAETVVGDLIPALGGLLKNRLPGINALVTDLPRGVLMKLTLDPSVVSISADTPVLAIDGNLTSSNGNGPARDAAPLRAVMGLSPSRPAAAGIGIAIIDSGITPSDAFAGRITAFYDFTRGGIETAPIDPYGHGTHVAGIIGSSGTNSGETSGSDTSGGSGSPSNDGQYRGLGPDARLIALRVLDDHGAGETSLVIQAIEFAIARRDTLGIDVINLSLGHPIYEPAASDPLVRAVERAVGAGIVVVASAGNFGYNAEMARSGYAGITSPGNAPSAITVGAMRGVETVTRDDDDVAPYSSRGPSWYDGFAKPDLLAFGHGIVSIGDAASTLYTDYPSVRAGSSLMRLNGTSMATAVTTGVVALMLEAHRQTHAQPQELLPTLAPATIKAILRYTSTPLDAIAGSPDALTQGAGAINAPDAIAAARHLDANITFGDDPAQPNVVWSQTIDWASNVVWGFDAVGTRTGDQTFTWGYVEDPLHTVWADLSTKPTGGQTFCWGDVDTSSTRRQRF